MTPDRAAFPSVALLSLALIAPQGDYAAAGTEAPQANLKRPFAELPYTPVLDLSAMDRTVDPCADLYQFSCGGWQKNNPIPADRGSWAVYSKTADENQQYLWGLLETAATAPGAPGATSGPGRTPWQTQIGDAFAACMDEAAIEAKGAAPLAQELAAIEGLGERAQIARWLGSVHRTIPGGGPVFGFESSQDLDDSETIIAWATAGGLGLPDRDYYLKRDPKSRETKQRYGEHVARMLALAGDGPAAARTGADAVLRLESELAKASLTNVESRDARNLKHRMTLAQLQELTPHFAWGDYFAGLGVPAPPVVNVSEPRFFRAVDKLVRRARLEDLRAWFRWQLVSERAAALSSAFVQADFDFYEVYLRGAKELAPRWKRCVGWVDDNLGEALGKFFVERTFTPATKASTADMVARIEAVMDRRIRALPWMGDATKAKALEKLAAMRNKIGYPDRWRDYSALAIRRDDYAGNAARAGAFEAARQLAKIGRPTDRGEWSMTPPTVNAYYDPANNDMNFPAGVLLPPLFDPKLDAAPNYGNTGGTIGHELIHGFDDDGRHFDARGNLTDWWTAADGAEFERRASCIVEQYGAYPVVDDLKINSRLTLGEDLADLGGLIIAWEAWKDLTKGEALPSVDGFTPGQRFFIGFAQWDCANESPESLRLRALTNPHSPAKYRINGVVVNMPEFAETFSCPAGSPMTKEPSAICRVW